MNTIENRNTLRTLYRTDPVVKKILDTYIAPKTNRVCIDANKVIAATGFAARQTQRTLRMLANLEVLEDTQVPHSYRLATKPEKIMKVARRKIRKESGYAPIGKRAKMWAPTAPGPTYKQWMEVNEALD